MKVCVREFTKEEVQTSSPASELERYYSLYVDNYSLTLVDVTDNRARKILNFDGYFRNNIDVFNDTIVPLLDRVVATHSAPQATIVLDGAAECRSQLLLGKEGVLRSAVQFTSQVEEIESIFLSIVRLEDNNRLVDCLEGSTPVEEEPVIMEDTLEHFTSVEDATYVDVLANDGLGALERMSAKDFASKHVIFSLICVYKNPETHPNTTVQFVSLAVEEVNRGMKSTRHAISSAAALIECRAPILSFTGTKLTFLLKPALLQQQPGVWISCFAPISPSDAAHRETFKEAFCVAQLAGRVFSARAGVDEVDGDSGSAPLPIKRGLARDQRQITSQSLLDKVPVPAEARSEGRATSTTDMVHAQMGDQPEPALRPSIEREYSRSNARVPSEERISPSEFLAYKQTMDETLARLRSDLRRCAGDLEESKDSLRREAARAKAQWEEAQQLQRTVGVLQGENEELRSHLQAAAEREAERVRSSGRGDGARTSGALTTVQSHEGSLVDAARAKELVHLVKYHQQEIHEHVQKEKAYRNRILDLESRLRAREDEVLVLTTKVNLDHPTKVNMLAEVTTAAATDHGPPPSSTEDVKLASSSEKEKRTTAELQTSLQSTLELVASQNERLQYLERELLRSQQQQHRTQGSYREATPSAAGKSAGTRETPVREANTSYQSTPREENGSSSSPPPRSREVLSGQPYSGILRPSSHQGAQTFEDFMNDAPRYKLRRRVL